MTTNALLKPTAGFVSFVVCIIICFAIHCDCDANRIQNNILNGCKSECQNKCNKDTGSYDECLKGSEGTVCTHDNCYGCADVCMENCGNIGSIKPEYCLTACKGYCARCTAEGKCTSADCLTDENCKGHCVYCISAVRNAEKPGFVPFLGR